MAFVVADRVLETCSAPGTGTVTLLGATTGYQTFLAAIGNANTTYYTIADQTGGNWEVGIGTYTSAGNTLARTTVLASSNAGALVNFSSGTQNVFVTYPAEKAVVASNNPGTSGNVLTSSGTGVAPAWTAASSVAVTTFSAGTTGFTPNSATGGAVTLAGTLGIANGGTNQTAYTAPSGNVKGLIFYDGTSFQNDTSVTDAGYDTNTHTLQGRNVLSTNGLFVNSQTVSSSYSIPSGYSASSTGPVSVAGGVTVTVPAGSRWVVI